MRLSIPVSILGASVIIALGLYFGLRSSTAPVTPAPVAAPVAAPPRPEPTPGPTEAQTAASVTQVIVEAHPRWRAACWDTADPATRKPGRYVASLAFDASGKLVIFGITEEREASDPAVAQCIRQQSNTFSIPAPGQASSFEVPFRMP